MTLTDTANTVGNFFTNGFSTIANNDALSYAIYNGVGGVPYAAIGMATVVVAVLGYATFSEATHDMAASINAGISIASEKIGNSVEYLKESVSNTMETVADKTSEIAEDVSSGIESFTTGKGSLPESDKEEGPGESKQEIPVAVPVAESEDEAEEKTGGKRNRSKKTTKKRRSRKQSATKKRKSGKQ